MTFIPTLDTDSKHRPRVPRTLDPVEVRILGSLMEKQLSTPEYYPLTLNALQSPGRGGIEIAPCRKAGVQAASHSSPVGATSHISREMRCRPDGARIKTRS
jgi:hypothetical protein